MALVVSLVLWLAICGVVARWILFRRRFGPLLDRATRATGGSGPRGTARSPRGLQPERPAVDSERAGTA